MCSFFVMPHRRRSRRPLHCSECWRTATDANGKQRFCPSLMNGSGACLASSISLSAIADPSNSNIIPFHQIRKLEESRLASFLLEQGVFLIFAVRFCFCRLVSRHSIVTCIVQHISSARQPVGSIGEALRAEVDPCTPSSEHSTIESVSYSSSLMRSHHLTHATSPYGHREAGSRAGAGYQEASAGAHSRTSTLLHPLQPASRLC